MQSLQPFTNVSNDRKGSKLKPDAPEFVPRRPETDTTDSPAKTETKEEANERRKMDKEQKKQEKDERKAQSSIGKKVSIKAGKRVDRSDYVKDSTGDESQSAGLTNEGPADVDASGNDKPKSKRARFGRRHQSKSEPASRVHESVDGAQDSDVTAVSSGEGQPIPQSAAMRRRRVSAPSDPPAGPQNGFIRGANKRRTRHWRLRNRAAENTGSGLASGTTTSGEGSTDEINSPSAPVTSPTAGFQPTSVRFAPGS
jgi:hypothetical protein